MSQLISRAWNWFQRLLLKRTILVLTLMFCVALGIALSNMYLLSSSLIESQAFENAKLYAQSLNHAIDLYSSAAVDRLKIKNIEVTSDYLSHIGAIPVPSTFAIELAKGVTQNNEQMMVRLYSDYPFPSRKAKGEGGAKDDFERTALNYLRRNPSQKFKSLEKLDGHTSLRYGEANIMKPSCVACHNTLPNSPKKDWEVGDVGGVWEINQSLDNFVAKSDANLQGTFFTLGGISVLGVSGLSLVIGKLGQTAKELEQRVRERTASLADANTDLDKRNKLIRHVFGRYISDNVVTNLLESPEALQLGGERRQITILTSDLRGFTALSERLQPEEVINILNLYLEYMAEVINRYHGTIDEFMGDGILVLFGAPLARENDATRAVACACAMQLAMGAVNENMKQLGLPRLEMGIGINTGVVVVGNIGSEKRTKYGIVGSQVNLTYRIESYTRGGQILISEPTFKEVGSIVSIEAQKQVQPKGFQQPITIYEVNGIGGFYNLFLPQEEEIFFPVPEQIPLQYTIVQGKHLNNTIFRGRLVKLSTKGAEILAESMEEDSLPLELTNVKFNLTPQDSTAVREDIYAKVRKKLPNTSSFWIHFTAVPVNAQAQLDSLYQSLSNS